MSENDAGMPADFSNFFEDPMSLRSAEYAINLEQGATCATVATFMLCAYRLLEFFAMHPTLESVSLTFVVTTAAQSGQSVEVLISHHNKVSAIGADIGLNDAQAQSEFVHRHLPYQALAQGHFVLERNSTDVQAYLQAPRVERARREHAVYEVAYAMSESFGRLNVVHGASALN